jgi:hypothetical protein
MLPLRRSQARDRRFSHEVGRGSPLSPSSPTLASPLGRGQPSRRASEPKEKTSLLGGALDMLGVPRSSKAQRSRSRKRKNEKERSSGTRRKQEDDAGVMQRLLWLVPRTPLAWVSITSRRGLALTTSQRSSCASPFSPRGSP